MFNLLIDLKMWTILTIATRDWKTVIYVHIASHATESWLAETVKPIDFIYANTLQSNFQRVG